MGSESKSFPLPSSSPIRIEGFNQIEVRRGRLWLEIAIGYGLILAAIWTPDGLLKIAWMLSAAVSISAFSVFGSYSEREMGLGFPPARGSLLIVSLGILLAGSVPVIALFFGANMAPAPVPWHSAWQYVIWAVLQEFILQSFLYVRIATLLGNRKAVGAAALLFALAHAPSPVLTLCTFVGGVFFCEMFRRYRNIYPIGIVHAGLGLTVAASFSNGILHHMRVGIGYLTFHPHPLS